MDQRVPYAHGGDDWIGFDSPDSTSLKVTTTTTTTTTTMMMMMVTTTTMMMMMIKVSVFSSQFSSPRCQTDR